MAVNFDDPAVKAAIDALVRERLTASGVVVPEPVKEPTAEESAQSAIDAVKASLARDGNRIVDHLGVIVSALEALLHLHTTSSAVTESSASASAAESATAGEAS